jgi:hypothetical protein
VRAITEGPNRDRPLAGWWERLPRPVRFFVRTLGVALGLVVAIYGVGGYALICFDTCPSDPDAYRVAQLFAASVMTLGVTTLVGALTAATRARGLGRVIMSVLAMALMLCGIAAFLFAQRIEGPERSTDNFIFAIIAIVVGGAVAAWMVSVLFKTHKRAESPTPMPPR